MNNTPDSPDSPRQIIREGCVFDGLGGFGGFVYLGLYMCYRPIEIVTKE